MLVSVDRRWIGTARQTRTHQMLEKVMCRPYCATGITECPSARKRVFLFSFSFLFSFVLLLLLLFAIDESYNARARSQTHTRTRLSVLNG